MGKDALADSKFFCNSFDWMAHAQLTLPAASFETPSRPALQDYVLRKPLTERDSYDYQTARVVGKAIKLAGPFGITGTRARSQHVKSLNGTVRGIAVVHQCTSCSTYY